uniref:Putative membrane protein insertion efficiency factor n=1 Tax=candidate division WOR-3 bacterium TaxID=2052148 RepID=A0A7C3UQW5_UNCW3
MPKLAEMTLSFLRFYQKVISPLLPPTCRFYPSCSEYSILAIKRYGIIRGTFLALLRLIRCHPFSPGGVDFPEEMYQRIWKT